MKKKFFSTAMAVVLLASFGLSQKTRIGFTTGASLANMYSKENDEKTHWKSKAGLTFGVLADIQIAKKCSFQPALNFTQKGTRDENSNVGYKFKLNINYLELPLNILYKSNGIGTKFFIGGGPSVGFALSGKYILKMNGEKETDKIHFGNGENDDYKPLDFSINALAGIESSKGIIVSLNYTYGITNIFHGDDDGTLRNTCFGLKIGYLINHAKK